MIVLNLPFLKVNDLVLVIVGGTGSWLVLGSTSGCVGISVGKMLLLLLLMMVVFRMLSHATAHSNMMKLLLLLLLLIIHVTCTASCWRTTSWLSILPIILLLLLLLWLLWLLIFLLGTPTTLSNTETMTSTVMTFILDIS